MSHKPFLDRMKHMILNQKTQGIIAPSTHAERISIQQKSPSAPHIVDVNESQGYLSGQLLVATPVINAGCFQKSVVYIFAHNHDGAMGVIVNQPLETVHFSSLVEGLHIPDSALHKEIPVYYGGPVDRARGFVIHTSDYKREHTLTCQGDVAVTASSGILEDIMMGRGPRKSALIVGYSGWAAGQLEQEIEQNSWITVPSSANLVFECENEFKWATASKSLGVDMNFFSTTVGHA